MLHQAWMDHKVLFVRDQDQHHAVPDHGGQRRRVDRVTLIGDRPV